jgi:membrane protein implicated in regulation of membrane protease activity
MALYALEIFKPQRGLIFIGTGALAAGVLQLALPSVPSSLPWLLFLAISLIGLVATRVTGRETQAD